MTPDATTDADPTSPASAPSVATRWRPSVSVSWRQIPSDLWLLAAIVATSLLAGLAIVDRNGYGNLYYAAAVRSGLRSTHNAWFAAFDPAGLFTVDKPPLVLWAQIALAHLIGFNSWALFIPSAVAWASGVLVLGLALRRYGHRLALVAALGMAVIPVGVAVARSNNPDALTVSLLVGAAAATMLAIRTGKLRHVVLVAVLVGLAFNTKMSVALVVLPGAAGAYMLAAPGSLWRRFQHLVLAGVVCGVVASAWVLAVDATPKANRPYVSSTANDTESQLVFQYNGIDHLTGQTASIKRAVVLDGSPSGVLRLLDARNAGQVAWLFPLAAVGAVLGLAKRRPRTDLRRATLVVWAGWLATGVVLLSFVQGTYHPYYTSLLVPPVAVCAAFGFEELCDRVRTAAGRMLAVGTLLVSSALAIFIIARAGSWLWLISVIAILTLLACTMLLIESVSVGGPGAFRATLGIMLIAMLIAPAAWTASLLMSSPTGASPFVNPGSLRRYATSFPQPAAVPPKMLQYLESHRNGSHFLLATVGTEAAAPFIVATGSSVVAIGGYAASDPAPTLDQLRAWIADHELRYVLLPPIPVGVPGDIASSLPAFDGGGHRETWVRDHCHLLPFAASGTEPRPAGAKTTGASVALAQQRLYDCATPKP